jgi:hypothetical protein
MAATPPSADNMTAIAGFNDERIGYDLEHDVVDSLDTTFFRVIL